VSGLYVATYRGKVLIGASTRPGKIRVDHIIHDIAVVDSVAYFHLKHGVELSSFITEKQLHRQDGFGIRKHQPDFVFTLNGKKVCVEVELTPKAKKRMLGNIEGNFMPYDKQMWIVPISQTKILRILEDNMSAYPNIGIISLEEIADYIKQAGTAE
jgi:hypothetical protein